MREKTKERGGKLNGKRERMMDETHDHRRQKRRIIIVTTRTFLSEL